MWIVKRGSLRISLEAHPHRLTNILIVANTGLKHPMHKAWLVDNWRIGKVGVEYFVRKAVASFKSYKRKHNILQHKKLRKK